MNKFFKYIIASVFPEHCPYCGQPVTVGTPACAECEQHFPETIRECFAKGGYPCAAPFSYDGVFAEAIKNYKFHGRKDYTEKLSEQIAKAVSRSFENVRFDYVTCVPMHKNQLKIRGYNQSQLLAKGVAKTLNIPYSDLIIKHKENEPQHSLTSNQKRDNVKGVYKAINIDRIKGNNILVIDDIITTGYTLGECCKVLQKAGAKKICCATLCAKIIL